MKIEKLSELPDEILHHIAVSNLVTAEKLIHHNIPFRLVLKNNNDWDKPLPSNIMENFKDVLPLDIEDDTLDRCFYDEDSRCFVIVTKFNEFYYSKKLDLDDIVAVMINGKPLSINESLLEVNSTVLPLFSNEISSKIDNISEETNISRDYLVNSYAILRDSLEGKNYND
jgi:hypothetical protein